ncbi:MAG: PDZ domain-containing protein [Bacteroidales bacterium]|nr:PDZ domain-containing protein [Bacteroidales bacterium]
MRLFKVIILSAAVVLGTFTAAAQGTGKAQAGQTPKNESRDFSLGKWIEVNNAILKELSRSYVDSLPLGRMQRAGIDAMLESLDPYTDYVPEEEQETFQMAVNNTYGGIGAIIYKPDKNGNVIINEPYEDAPCVRAGLQCGDEIVEIDGVSTHGLSSGEASEKMRGKPGTVAHFKVKKVRGGASWKAGDVIPVDVTRERIVLPALEYVGMLDSETGYMVQSKFADGVSGAVRDAVHALKAQGMKRLVYDLRGNGGGLLGEAVKIVSLFVPKGSTVVSAKGRAAGADVTYTTIGEPVDLEIPITVLVDSGSASASEIVAGALQDLDRATIIGTRTFGKGLVQSIRPLPYGGQLKVTTAKYYTPSGRCVQAIDYAKRREDGSVEHIPDSLTHEFRTLKGRIVRDGGGITPDIEIKGKKYSRLTYSLVLGGIIEEYTLKFVREHESIGPIDSFHFNDYDDFVAFAADKNFDYRSEARAWFDEMKRTMEEDGIAEGVAPQLETLEKHLDMDKETFLRLKKDEIIPFIEEEIAIRYYYQRAGVRIHIRYDTQLHEALRHLDQAKRVERS